MKITFIAKMGDRQIQIEDEVANEAEAWKVVAFWDSLPQVGPNGQTDLKFSYRTPEGYEYYSIECPSAGKEFKFGQLREGKGKLFPKDWAPILHGREEFEEEPAPAPARPSPATPQRPSTTAAPAATNIASIDSGKYFTFARENGISHREAEEIRLACTAGGKVHWDRALEELRKLTAVSAPRTQTPAQARLLEIFATMKKLGVSEETLDAKLSKICDGVCEIESLDETQTAKALAVFNRDLQAKQAEAQRRRA